MMMISVRLSFCLILGALCLGCSSDDTESVTPAPPPGLKKILEDVASSGQPIGSQGMEIQNHIDQMRQTDAAKADELSKDLQQLSSLSNPPKIKAKASEMLKKL